MVHLHHSVWIFANYKLVHKVFLFSWIQCCCISICAFTSEMSTVTHLLKVKQHVLGHLYVPCLGLCVVPQWYCIRCPSGFVSPTDLCRRQKVLHKHCVDLGNAISHMKDTFRALSEMASWCLNRVIVCLVFRVCVHGRWCMAGDWHMQCRTIMSYWILNELELQLKLSNYKKHLWWHGMTRGIRTLWFSQFSNILFSLIEQKIHTVQNLKQISLPKIVNN